MENIIMGLILTGIFTAGYFAVLYFSRLLEDIRESRNCRHVTEKVPDFYDRFLLQRSYTKRGKK